MDNLVTLELVEMLKNSGFILQSKMTELNQNKNSEQSNPLDAL